MAAVKGSPSGETTRRVGAQIGRYELAERISTGIAGDLYKARERSLKRPVVIQFLDVATPASGLPAKIGTAVAERLEAVLCQVSALNHPAFVQLLEADFSADDSYVVMEHLDGEALDVRLAREPRLPAVAACDLALQAVRALGAAWKEHHLIVQDLTPASFFVQRGHYLKIHGLGIVAAVRDERTRDFRSLSGTAIGQPAYLAPEQLYGARALPTHTADIYALGIILFQMLTGKLPFNADDDYDMFLLKIAGPGTDLREVGGLPNDLVTLVYDMLAARPADRPQTYDEIEVILTDVIDRLRVVALGLPTPPSTPTPPGGQPSMRLGSPASARVAAAPASTTAAPVAKLATSAAPPSVAVGAADTLTPSLNDATQYVESATADESASPIPAVVAVSLDMVATASVVEAESKADVAEPEIAVVAPVLDAVEPAIVEPVALEVVPVDEVMPAVELVASEPVSVVPDAAESVVAEPFVRESAEVAEVAADDRMTDDPIQTDVATIDTAVVEVVSEAETLAPPLSEAPTDAAVAPIDVADVRWTPAPTDDSVLAAEWALAGTIANDDALPVTPFAALDFSDDLAADPVDDVATDVVAQVVATVDVLASPEAIVETVAEAASEPEPESEPVMLVEIVAAIEPPVVDEPAVTRIEPVAEALPEPVVEASPAVVPVPAFTAVEVAAIAETAPAPAVAETPVVPAAPPVAAAAAAVDIAAPEIVATTVTAAADTASPAAVEPETPVNAPLKRVSLKRKDKSPQAARDEASAASAPVVPLDTQRSIPGVLSKDAPVAEPEPPAPETRARQNRIRAALTNKIRLAMSGATPLDLADDTENSATQDRARRGSRRTIASALRTTDSDATDVQEPPVTEELPKVAVAAPVAPPPAVVEPAAKANTRSGGGLRRLPSRLDESSSTESVTEIIEPTITVPPVAASAAAVAPTIKVDEKFPLPKTSTAALRRDQEPAPITREMTTVNKSATPAVPPPKMAIPAKSAYEAESVTEIIEPVIHDVSQAPPTVNEAIIPPPVAVPTAPISAKVTPATPVASAAPVAPVVLVPKVVENAPVAKGLESAAALAEAQDDEAPWLNPVPTDEGALWVPIEAGVTRSPRREFSEVDDIPFSMNPGDHVGDFVIDELIGVGTIGAVYRAHHLQDHREVALKCLVKCLPTQLRRREIIVPEILALHNRHALPVHLIAEDNGLDYIVSDLILRDGNKPLSLGLACRPADDPQGLADEALFLALLRKAAEGVAAAHAIGLVHGNLKPDNILVVPGEENPNDMASAHVLVSDFATVQLIGERYLVNRASDTLRKTDGGGYVSQSMKAVMTSYDYLSPEMRRGQTLNASSDIYMLGLLALRLLTGQKALWRRKPPSQMRPGLSAGWDEVLIRTLQPLPADRYPHATALLDALASIEVQAPTAS